MQIIPLPEQLKAKIDVAAVPSAMSMPWLTEIPWAQVASFFAAVYAALRLLEWGWVKGWQLIQWVRARRSAAAQAQSVDK